MKIRWPIVASLLAALFGTAGAATIVAFKHVPRASSRALLPVVSWDALANVEPTESGPAPQFDARALALDGRTVTLDGYMTPFNLGDGATVSSFLLTGTPGTCPFCMGAGPASFVIIAASVPVPIDITSELSLQGRFKVMQNDATGFYYRLDGAIRAP